MDSLMDAKAEFRAFFILLRQDKWFNTVSNYHQLEQINGSCNKTASDSWQYSLPRLEFKNIDTDRHVKPNFISGLVKSGFASSKIILSISCTCNLSCNIDVIKDPITTLATKFIVQLEYLSQDGSNDLKVLQSSWHLDRHDATKKTNTIHPLYHYEFGGSEISKAESFNYGDFILIDAPRIMHPPLDIVLSIDFIIKNYYKGKDHASLTNQPLYKKYIKNAQFRLWRPYLLSLASHFHDFGVAYDIDKMHAQNLLHCI